MSPRSWPKLWLFDIKGFQYTISNQTHSYLILFITQCYYYYKKTWTTMFNVKLLVSHTNVRDIPSVSGRFGVVWRWWWCWRGRRWRRLDPDASHDPRLQVSPWAAHLDSQRSIHPTVLGRLTMALWSRPHHRLSSHSETSHLIFVSLHNLIFYLLFTVSKIHELHA